MIPLAVVLTVVGSFVFSHLMDRVMGLSHAARCLAAVGMVAPVGFSDAMRIGAAAYLVGWLAFLFSQRALATVPASATRRAPRRLALTGPRDYS